MQEFKQDFVDVDFNKEPPQWLELSCSFPSFNKMRMTRWTLRRRELDIHASTVGCRLPCEGCCAWQVRAHFKGGISDVELYQFFLDSDKASNLHVPSIALSSTLSGFRFRSQPQPRISPETFPFKSMWTMRRC